MYNPAGIYGGNSAAFNWFDPNAWSSTMPRPQQPQTQQPQAGAQE